MKEWWERGTRGTRSLIEHTEEDFTGYQRVQDGNLIIAPCDAEMDRSFDLYHFWNERQWTFNFSNRTSQDQESIRSPMKGILEYRELDESEIPNNERITRQNRDHGLFKINVQGWSIGYRRNFPYISIRLWIAKRVPCCWHSWFSGQFRLVREEGNVQTRGRIHWIVNIFATPLCTIIPQLRPISITTGDHVQVLGYYVTTHRRVAY